MNKGEIIKKGISAILTIGFMAVVRPDDSATIAGAAFVAILLFESLQWCVGYIWIMKTRSDMLDELKARYEAKEQMRRVEAQDFRREIL